MEVRRRSRLLLQICHVANAEGGETGQIDKSGAARSALREDTVLSICLVRGGRPRLPPDGKAGFGLSKSRLTYQGMAKDLRSCAQKGPSPEGQITAA